MTTTPTIPSRDAIVEALLDALRLVRDRDKALLDLRVGERALVHRLAVYLERDPLFCGWSVDCEYDREGGDDPKRLAAVLQARIAAGKAKPTDRATPDLIVHQRMVCRDHDDLVDLRDRNLLVLEAKRDATSPDEFDLIKLEAFHDDRSFQYRHTAFISFHPLTVWFDTHENGGVRLDLGATLLRSRLSRS